MKPLKYTGIAFLFLMISCTSIDYSQKLTSDDCMVLIPVGLDKSAGTVAARSYTITIPGLEKPVEIPKVRNGYIPVKIRRDSQDIEALKSSVSNRNFSGKSTSDEIFQELPYEPGQVVVCDFRIVQKIEKVGNSNYDSVNFLPVTEKEMESIQEDFLSQEINASWVEEGEDK